MHEGEVFLKEGPMVLEFISLPRVFSSDHQFCICWWYEAVFCPYSYYICNIDGVLGVGPGEDHEEWCNV